MTFGSVIKYLAERVTFKTSRPEKTHDRGWEIRWIFFKTAFTRKPREKDEKLITALDRESVD